MYRYFAMARNGHARILKWKQPERGFGGSGGRAFFLSGLVHDEAS